MTKVFKSVERVLALEAQQGYQDKAVVGGIRQFAAHWVGQAREETLDEADAALVEQIAEVLSEYGRMPGREARAKAIGSLIASLERRAKRVEKASGGQTAVAAPPLHETPRPTAKTAPPKAQPAEKEIAVQTAVVESKRRPEPPAPKPVPVAVTPDPAGLAQPVSALKGVGPKIAEKLEKLGITTINDLLYLYPRRYDDYTLMKPISKIEVGEQVTVIGTIWQTTARRVRGNATLVQSVISDGTGTIQATWFNQPWLAKQLPAGLQLVLSGKVDQFLGRPVFNSPDWEPLDLDPLRTRRIVPIYPLTEGLAGNRLRELMQKTVEYWSLRVSDPLPEEIRTRQNLLTLPQALQQIHFPESQDMLFEARRRLAFDELFLLQLGMQGQRRQWQSQDAMAVASTAEQLQQFRDALPFALTAAQERVIQEILHDMAQQVPMNRLLQGDVGAGKTAVAAAAMVMTAQAGNQAALMAPTEILAEQHFRGLSTMLAPMGLDIALLVGSTPAAEKSRIYDGLADGSIQIVVGTHALIQDPVNFRGLALAVIDEQHRFGVEQRGALREKGGTEEAESNPHLLVMSATPIPRTLALSLYGDLDLSILDEMPPGRQEIKTRWLQASERERAYTFVRRQVAEGRQAFIIFPLVEESEKIDAKAAVEEFEVLRKEVFPDLSLGLVHGRLRAEEKESAMRAFYEGETDILVATSVIEVGVDVPNSTVMVIEGANRFGLAQLHQFRGRVGRGEHQSYCVLIAGEGSEEAEQRLLALEQTNDGFVLAEKDLEMRGPGEFFGRRQSGLPELQLASLLDMPLLETAQKEAVQVFAADPDLQAPAHEQLRACIVNFWQESGDVS